MKIENIKFKAKRLDNGEWIIGSFVVMKIPALSKTTIGIVAADGATLHEIDPSTVCQFTGLKDCEGNQIWEGDIIRNPEFPFEKRAVTWSNNSSCFMPIDEDGCQDKNFSFLVLFKKWTVVGNKFDKEK